MDDARANPIADALLGALEDELHEAGGLGCVLDAVEALPGIAQSVGRRR